MATFASSGTIYLGAQSGVTVSRSVGAVRGYSQGSTVTMNDATVRSFAAKYNSGTTIKMSDFHGRTYFDGDKPSKGDDLDFPIPA